MIPDVAQIEALGKVGGAIIGIVCLSFLFWQSLKRTDADRDMDRRMTEAMEKIAEVYSGEPIQ